MAGERGRAVLYRILVDGTPHSVRLEVGPEGTFRARVGDQELAGRWSPGLVLLEDRVLAYAVGRDGRGLPAEVLLRGRRFPVSVVGMGDIFSDGEALAATGAGGGRVVAPMNGRVVRVVQAPGHRVEAGGVVLILEAMKMENEVASPVAGTLREVAVEEGASVHPGDLLFVVEEDGGA